MSSLPEMGWNRNSHVNFEVLQTFSPYICLVLCCAKSLQLCLTLWPQRMWPVRLFCPWDSPGKNIGMNCCFLLQASSQCRRWNLHLFHLLHWQAGSLPLVSPGKPRKWITVLCPSDWANSQGCSFWKFIFFVCLFACLFVSNWIGLHTRKDRHLNWSKVMCKI